MLHQKGVHILDIIDAVVTTLDMPSPKLESSIPNGVSGSWETMETESWETNNINKHTGKKNCTEITLIKRKGIELVFYRTITSHSFPLLVKPCLLLVIPDSTIGKMLKKIVKTVLAEM